jgi:flagellar biosynthesis/type III secretory pathway ATPase
MNPLDRSPVKQVLDVGVRAINGLLTVGRGQRLGLFAGSGVGKSVLLGMMARFTRADVVVVGLIGERGREVKDFIENILGEEGIARAVVVAAGRHAAADALAWRGLCHRAGRVFPRPGQGRAAADGFGYPLCHGAA